MRHWFWFLMGMYKAWLAGVKIVARGGKKPGDPDPPFNLNNWGLDGPEPRVQDAILRLMQPGSTYSHDGVNYVVEVVRARGERVKLILALGFFMLLPIWAASLVLTAYIF